MKDIKYFKYKNTYEYNKFLKECGYTLDDVKGFCLCQQTWYHGNLLKIYAIHFKDCKMKPFSVIYFKNINEYHQTHLGLSNERLLWWYQGANIIEYKVKDLWGKNDKYVIAM